MLFHNAYDLKTEYGLTLLKMIIDLKNKGFIKRLEFPFMMTKSSKLSFQNLILS